MLGFDRRRVKVALLLMLLFGCFWRSYARRMIVHADLLVAMAHKGANLVSAGRFAAESLPELTYPLARAVRFATEAHQRSTGPPPASLLAFETLLQRYRSFIDATDRVRQGDLPGRRALLAAPLAAVDEAARDVHDALAREHG